MIFFLLTRTDILWRKPIELSTDIFILVSYLLFEFWLHKVHLSGISFRIWSHTCDRRFRSFFFFMVSNCYCAMVVFFMMILSYIHARQLRHLVKQFCRRHESRSVTRVDCSCDSNCAADSQKTEFLPQVPRPFDLARANVYFYFAGLYYTAVHAVSSLYWSEYLGFFPSRNLTMMILLYLRVMNLMTWNSSPLNMTIVSLSQKCSKCPHTDLSFQIWLGTVPSYL